MRRISCFVCPYDDMACIYLDTAGMFKLKECYDCEFFNAGHKKIKQIPIARKFTNWLTGLFKKKKCPREEDYNNFMMGL